MSNSTFATGFIIVVSYLAYIKFKYWKLARGVDDLTEEIKAVREMRDRYLDFAKSYKEMLDEVCEKMDCPDLKQKKKKIDIGFIGARVEDAKKMGLI